LLLLPAALERAAAWDLDLARCALDVARALAADDFACFDDAEGVVPAAPPDDWTAGRGGSAVESGRTGSGGPMTSAADDEGAGTASTLGRSWAPAGGVAGEPGSALLGAGADEPGSAPGAGTNPEGAVAGAPGAAGATSLGDEVSDAFGAGALEGGGAVAGALIAGAAPEGGDDAGVGAAVAGEDASVAADAGVATGGGDAVPSAGADPGDIGPAGVTGKASGGRPIGASEDDGHQVDSSARSLTSIASIVAGRRSGSRTFT
jgi:hypothetical protein